MDPTRSLTQMCIVIESLNGVRKGQREGLIGKIGFIKTLTGVTFFLGYSFGRFLATCDARERLIQRLAKKKFH